MNVGDFLPRTRRPARTGGKAGRALPRKLKSEYPMDRSHEGARMDADDRVPRARYSRLGLAGWACVALAVSFMAAMTAIAVFGEPCTMTDPKGWAICD